MDLEEISTALNMDWYKVCGIGFKVLFLAFLVYLIP